MSMAESASSILPRNNEMWVLGRGFVPPATVDEMAASMPLSNFFPYGSHRDRIALSGTRSSHDDRPSSVHG